MKFHQSAVILFISSLIVSLTHCLVTADTTKIKINPADQTCQIDDDCILIETDCSGGCDCNSFESVNKNTSFSKYSSALDQLCANHITANCEKDCHFKSQCANNRCQKISISASPQPEHIIIDPSDQRCETTSDCTAIHTDCDDCSCGNLRAINRSTEERYSKDHLIMCKNYHGPICDLNCPEKIECIQKQCQMVDPSRTNPDDCQKTGGMWFYSGMQPGKDKCILGPIHIMDHLPLAPKNTNLKSTK